MKLFAALLCSLFFATHSHAHSADGTLVFVSTGQHVHLKWATPPKLGEEAILNMQWMNNAPHGAAEPKGRITMDLWMPMPGEEHGSAPVVIEHATDDNGNPKVGAFRVSRIFFIMNGVWQVRATLTKEDGSAETQIWEVPVGVKIEEGGEQ